MKKIIIALLVVSALGVTSCKKDNGITPAKSTAVKVNDRGDLGTWD
ncbi:MAG: hypothetical protein IE931_04150 [Sphingobacteriales bacterium]|nr:hypothetical protein [Sphingobacteriales bacterium]